MKKLTIFFTLFVLCLVFVMQPTQCFAAAYVDRLESGEYIFMRQSITSRNNKYRLDMQSDGNLVLYNKDKGQALWQANTAWSYGAKCIMQKDGNLVVYAVSNMNEKNIMYDWPVWSSNTANNPGARLVLQDDGNLVIYNGSKAIWATNTSGK